MNINKGKAIRLLQDPNWEIVELTIEELKERIRSETPKAETEFQTIWNLAFKEGQINGIQLLINKLNEYAQE